MPYVFVADEAFPLQRHLLRPYPGRELSMEQQAFNYRLSRARRIVESAFGLLSNRWRIFDSKIDLKPEVINQVIKACCVLHNIVQRNSESNPGEDEIGEMQGLQINESVPKSNSLCVRDKYKTYFVQNPVAWQSKYLQRGLED